MKKVILITASNVSAYVYQSVHGSRFPGLEAEHTWRLFLYVTHGIAVVILFYPFLFRNRFILAQAVVATEPIPGTLGLRELYTLNGSPVFRRAECTTGNQRPQWKSQHKHPSVCNSSSGSIQGTQELCLVETLSLHHQDTHCSFTKVELFHYFGNVFIFPHLDGCHSLVSSVPQFSVTVLVQWWKKKGQVYLAV